MSAPGTTATPPPLQALRTTVGAVMGGLVVLTLVVGSVLGFGGYPPVWVPWALGALAVLAHVACTTVGYRTTPVRPGTAASEAARTGRSAFQQSTFVRMALCEAVGIVAVAAAFVVDSRTGMTVVVGAVLSLALLALHAWPGERTIARVQRSLDRDGGQSFLSDTMRGQQPGQNGAFLP